MQLLNQINKAHCLVLDKRYADYEKLSDEFAGRLGLPLKLFLAGDGHLIDKQYDHKDVECLPPLFENSIQYPTWHNRPNAYNAYLSHYKMMEQAKKEGNENLLIVEDDAFLEQDFEVILSRTDNFFKNTPWDMVYFGSYHDNNTIAVHDHILKVNGSGGWHGVLLKLKLFEELISYGPIGPFDWICGKYIHNKYNCYAIWPCIISQKDGHSYVEGHYLSKPSRDKR